MRKPIYQWIAAGEEWSEPWGGSAAQWFGSILPRIQIALPAETVVELGSGFGRWSSYLREHCRHLHLVDPDRQCMDACRERFGADGKIRYHLNEADSLEMIPDGSIDFIFSFDSLVHVQRTALARYVQQFAAKLTPTGLAFIHHSNLGAANSSIAHRALTMARGRRASGKNHQRDPEMSAELFRELCEHNNLKVVTQEALNWRGRRLIDCFSTIARADSKWQRAHRIYRNSNFMLEAALIRRRARQYPKEKP